MHVYRVEEREGGRGGREGVGLQTRTTSKFAYNTTSLFSGENSDGPFPTFSVNLSLGNHRLIIFPSSGVVNNEKS